MESRNPITWNVLSQNSDRQTHIFNQIDKKSWVSYTEQIQSHNEN